MTLVWWHNATQGAGPASSGTTSRRSSTSRTPNVTIKAVPLQNEQFKTKIPIALQSSSPPDVFQNWGGGQLVDQVKARQGRRPHEVRQAVDQDASAARPPAGRSTASSTAIPYNLGVVGFWYNKELFAKAGITSPPKTWPQFIADIAKLKAAGIAPIAIGSKDQWPDAFYWDYLAVKLCSKAVMQKSAVTLQLQRPVLAQGGSATLQQLLDAKPFQDGFLATPAQQGATSSAGLLAQRQGGDGAAGPLEPGRDAAADARQEGPELPRLVPVPERPGQQGAPRLAARRR